MIGRRLLLGAGLALAACCASGPVSRGRSVKVFGARGDGLADDTAAIQMAIDSDAPALDFPAGRYRVTQSLRPRAHQRWSGENSALSVLAATGDASFNLIEETRGIAGLELSGLGFSGDLAAGRANQKGFGLYLRGSATGITLRACTFENFAGGGVVIGPVPGHGEDALADILVTGCRFAANRNVPGIYLSGGGAPGRNITVAGNRFLGAAPGANVQNCVYILGNARNGTIENVRVTDNVFDIATPVDACIELNFVDDFDITGNVITIAAGIDGSSGVLIRDGCRNGSIGRNALTDKTDGKQIGGILLLNFANPGTIESVSVAGNSLTGFTWRAIAADRGSRAVTISRNAISGKSRTTSEAVRIAGARDVTVERNIVAGALYPVLLTGTGESRDEGVAIRDNVFTDCGGQPGLILGADGVDLARLAVTGNRVVSPRAGTYALLGNIRPASLATVAGNSIGALSQEAAS